MRDVGCSLLCFVFVFNILQLCIAAITEFPEEVLFVTDSGRHGVFYIDLQNPVMQRPVYVGRSGNPIAIDYNYRTKRVYWSDVVMKYIVEGYVTRHGNYSLRAIRMLPRVSVVDGLAVDLITGNLYYTCDGEDFIAVMNRSGGHHRFLVTERLEHPRPVLLHPEEGYMYWSDWGANPKIEKAYMDGTNRVVLVSRGLGWPNGLALDRKNRRLYWCDGQTNRIESVTLGGGDRQVFASAPQMHFFGLATDGKFLVYSNWHENYRALLSNSTLGLKYKDIHRVGPAIGPPSRMNDLAVHTKNSPGVGTNACSNNNGGCAALCLPFPGGRSCACADGWRLKNNLRDCEIIPYKHYLVFTDMVRRGLFRLDLATLTYSRVEKYGHGVPAGLDYDARTDTAFWTDMGTTPAVASGCALTMVTADCTTQALHVFPFTGGHNYTDVVYDKPQRTLYVLDAVTKSIKTLSSEAKGGTGNYHSDPTSLANPQSIAMHKTKRYLIWSNAGGNRGIYRLDMSSKTQRRLVSKSMSFASDANIVPRGVFIDQKANKIYWVESKYGTVEVCNHDGSSPRTLSVIGRAEYLAGITADDRYIYLTGWNSRGVMRVSKLDGSGFRVIGAQKFARLHDIQVATPDQLAPLKPVTLPAITPGPAPTRKVTPRPPATPRPTARPVTTTTTTETPAPTKASTTVKHTHEDRQRGRDEGVPGYVFTIIGVLAGMAVVAVAVIVMVVLYRRSSRPPRHLLQNQETDRKSVV